jgi:hypothetical protein
MTSGIAELCPSGYAEVCSADNPWATLAVGIMPPMSDAPTPPRVTSLPPMLTPRSETEGVEKMVCERCGRANVYRMHAVWRCADCGFKTDCCGW